MHPDVHLRTHAWRVGSLLDEHSKIHVAFRGYAMTALPQTSSATPVSLEQRCAELTEHWSPRILLEANGQYLKVARIQGEFPWHDHANEDELFLVLRGALTIGRSPEDGGPVTLQAGEAFVVPRGTRHNTAAAEETWIALFEPAATRHTGDEQSALTRSLQEQLRPLP
jgi:quercetin dioxygenase-like cupin family protein